MQYAYRGEINILMNWWNKNLQHEVILDILLISSPPKYFIFPRVIKLILHSCAFGRNRWCLYAYKIFRENCHHISFQHFQPFRYLKYFPSKMACSAGMHGMNTDEDAISGNNKAVLFLTQGRRQQAPNFDSTHRQCTTCITYPCIWTLRKESKTGQEPLVWAEWVQLKTCSTLELSTWWA